MGIRISANHGGEFAYQLSEPPDHLVTRLIQEILWLERVSVTTRTPGSFEDLKEILVAKGQNLAQALGVDAELGSIAKGDFVEVETSCDLNQLPLEVLAVDRECLGLRNPVSRTLLFDQAPHQRNRFSQNPKVLIVTTSRPHPSLVLEGEKESLDACFARQRFRTQCWSWSDAPEGGELASLKALLKTADVLHFAGHLEEHQGIARFQLDGQRNQWLSATDLQDMGLRASLVWLSTCSGGVTNGVHSFAQSVLCAGASVCVGASVPMSDSSMSMACRTFYRKLFDGHCAGHAMLECRRQLARLGSTAWVTTLLMGSPRWAVSQVTERT